MYVPCVVVHCIAGCCSPSPA